MKYIGWIALGWFLLLCAHNAEAIGDMGATSEDRLPFYSLALITLIAALTCFFKGLRGAYKAMTGGGRPDPTPKPENIVPASRQGDALSTPEFDVDGAFAHYMQNRNIEPSAESSGAAPSQPQRPTFGRKSG